MPDSDLDYVDKQIAATIAKIARQRGMIAKVRTLKADARQSERLTAAKASSRF